jgi:hypothetical protein
MSASTASFERHAIGSLCERRPRPRALIRILPFAVGILFAAAPAKIATAQNYPWCAHYSEGGMLGATECFFSTLEQCQASVSGVGGFCDRNPWYAPARKGKKPRRKKR